MSELPQEILDDIARMDREITVEVAGVGTVDRGRLKEAFELIRNSEHWKNPIDATIANPGEEMIAIMCEAVSFFCGCELVVNQVQDQIRVQADGYFLTLGA